MVGIRCFTVFDVISSSCAEEHFNGNHFISRNEWNGINYVDGVLRNYVRMLFQEFHL